MRNPNTRKKLRAVFKAALWGVALSLGFTLFAQHYFQGKNDLFWDLCLMIPTFILSSILGTETTPGGRSLSHSFTFMVIANVLVITFIFIVFAFFWQFVVKGGPENKK